MADKARGGYAKAGAGWNSPRTWLLLVGVAVLLLAAGVALVITLPGTKKSGLNAAARKAGETKTTMGIDFTVQPSDGSTAVLPSSTISVTAPTGKLVDVTVQGTDGTTIAGSISPKGTAWHSTAALALNMNYAVNISGQASTGNLVTAVTHFATLTPDQTLTYTLAPSKGLTVGVGEPIVLRFDKPVPTAAQAAMLNQLQVTESNPVVGGWHWFDNEELHFRPEAYWPSGEQVSLAANLSGFNLNNGVFAMSNQSTNFTVGDAHISTANVQTDQMTVTDNGNVVATYPISAGRTIYPTMNGTHIDLYRAQSVHMVSSTVGIPVNSANGYDEWVYWDVNISDSGEFVHAAPWSLGDQGRSNVSHGCINVSPANAQSFYNFSHVGDVIQVVGSPRPASLGDHGTMDWTEPWANWTVAPILSAATGQPAVISTTTTTMPPSTTTSAPPAAPSTTTTTAPRTVTTTVPATTSTTAIKLTGTTSVTP